MRSLFCFDKTLFTALPKNKTMARLQEMFSGDYGRELSDLTVTEDTLSFSVKDHPGLVYNSFRPDVWMRMMEQDGGTGIQLRCQAKRFVRVFACVYLSLLALIAVGMVLSLIRGQLDPAMLLIPLGMAVFMLLLCYCGLRLSSKWIITAAQNVVRFHEMER